MSVTKQPLTFLSTSNWFWWASLTQGLRLASNATCLLRVATSPDKRLVDASSSSLSRLLALLAELLLGEPLGEVLLGEVLLGEVLLDEVLPDEVLLGEVSLGEVLLLDPLSGDLMTTLL